ncbi:MAG: hypothetical protein ACRD6I_17310, partial [Candidatus Acidiferrales bacterium]
MSQFQSPQPIRSSITSAGGFFLTSLLLYFLTSTVASAQQRPLQTPDAEILPAGMMEAQIGFDFLQDVD